MNTILKRIEQIAKNEGIGITALERNIGASSGVLSRAIRNNTDIQAKWLQRIIENYPQYSALWLLTGKGGMRSEAQAISQEERPPTAAESIYREIIAEKDEMIGRLNQEIGRLKERVGSLRADGGEGFDSVELSGSYGGVPRAASEPPGMSGLPPQAEAPAKQLKDSRK